jgi:hypothetical protein
LAGIRAVRMKLSEDRRVFTPIATAEPRGIHDP